MSVTLIWGLNVSTGRQSLNGCLNGLGVRPLPVLRQGGISLLFVLGSRIAIIFFLK